MFVNYKKLNFVLAIIATVSSVHFWGIYFSIKPELYDVIDVVFYIAISLIFINYLLQKNKTKSDISDWIFSKPLVHLFIALYLSTLSCWYYHDQFPLLTALAMRFFIFLILYYALMLSQIDRKKVIMMMLVFTAIYIIIFSIQIVVFPTAIVPLGRLTEFDRGFLRLRMEGVGFVTMCGLYLLNRYLQSRKIIHLLGYALCFMFVFILGFRTLVLTYLISSVTLSMMVNKSIVKTIIKLLPLLLLLFLLSQLNFIQNFFEESVMTSAQQLEAGDDYIRFLTFNFLFQNVNIDWVTIIFGNGQPFSGTAYGNLVLGYGAEEMGFIAADLGLIGFVFNYGLISSLLFLNIFRKGIQTKVQIDSLYLKAFFLYLIISSFTTAEIYRAGMFGPICIALYLINYSHLKARSSLDKGE